MRRFYFILASGLYSGLLPRVPGTWGSAAACIFWVFLKYIGLLGSLGSELILILLTTAIGVVASKVCLEELRANPERAARFRKPEDPGFIVIDEWAGMFVTLFGVTLTWTNLFVAFVLFRFFDIVKPAPARQIEKWHGAYGIMFDDLVAGIYARIVLSIFILLLG